MRWLISFLLFLLIMLQYRLWLGDGSVSMLWDLEAQIAVQQEENQRLQQRNRAMEAEVIDLKNGEEAIEERARSELGMIKDGETFYQILDE